MLAVAGGAKVDSGPRGECDAHDRRTPELLPTATADRSRNTRPMSLEGETMTQPEFTAARARLIAQRRVQARRRAVVTALLGVVLLALIPVVALTSLPAWALAVPGALMLTVLIAGRRAVVRQERADAEIARRARVAHRAALATRMSAGLAGSHRAHRPVPVAQPRNTEQRTALRDSTPAAGLDWSASVEEVLERVDTRRAAEAGGAEDRGQDQVAARDSGSIVERDAQRAVAARSAADGATGAARGAASAGVVDAAETAPAVQARRVPRPVYASKSAAPRWEPAPMSAEIERATRAMANWDAQHANDIDADVAIDVSGASEQGDAVLGSQTIDGLLDRRRAAGE